MTPIPGNPQCLGAFDLIDRAYFKNDSLAVPTAGELTEIEAATATMDLTGKGLMIGSAGVFFVSLAMWSIPYVGALVGLLTVTAGVVIGTIGYDLHVGSQNLEQFANRRWEHVGTNAVKSLLHSTNITHDQFRKEMLKVAAQGTIIVKMLYEIAVAKNKL